ncbi:MAG: folylpolyglutamate synthase/dihydrofolate synthase family protein [Bacillota bacterium]|nr:folylpolyglutamate synthase/dihydrofolate synthase family protein [Bacillota bacterium]
MDKALRFGSKAGLGRISALLSSIGNPQDKLKYVHIAGTNGKGSTSAMLASVLKYAGYKTGLYISPYVEDFLERIQLDGAKITEEDFSFHLSRLVPHIEKLCGAGLEPLNQFEIITAVAFDYFACKGCDFVSLEVGLGGRFDATNVIKAPEAAVICSLSEDHTEYLGDTLEQIAAEKCGIIKEGSDVLAYANNPLTAQRIINEACLEKKACLTVPDTTKLTVLSRDISGSKIRYGSLEVFVPLAGEHQILNALSVIEAGRALRKRGFCITDGNIADGIRETKFPARLETVRQEPLCVIDGAHNRGGITALSSEIDCLFSGKRLISVMGMLKDKEYAFCIPQIAMRSDVFIATSPETPRALEAGSAASIAEKHCQNVYRVPEINDAVALALSKAKNDDVILVCGSLYMLGQAKRKLMEK